MYLMFLPVLCLYLDLSLSAAKPRHARLYVHLPPTVDLPACTVKASPYKLYDRDVPGAPDWAGDHHAPTSPGRGRAGLPDFSFLQFLDNITPPLVAAGMIVSAANQEQD